MKYQPENTKFFIFKLLNFYAPNNPPISQIIETENEDSIVTEVSSDNIITEGI